MNCECVIAIALGATYSIGKLAFHGARQRRFDGIIGIIVIIWGIATLAHRFA